jgi:hypothetical protein
MAIALASEGCDSYGDSPRCKFSAAGGDGGRLTSGGIVMDERRMAIDELVHCKEEKREAGEEQ